MKQSNFDIITNNEFKMARDYFSNLAFARGNSKPTITSCYICASVALEKQIPRKVERKVNKFKIEQECCPNCEQFFQEERKYCFNCGQRLDWSNDDDNKTND